MSSRQSQARAALQNRALCSMPEHPVSTSHFKHLPHAFYPWGDEAHISLKRFSVTGPTEANALVLSKAGAGLWHTRSGTSASLN